MYSAVFSSICCALPLSRDPARRAGKDRFAYLLSVVHFRKVVIWKKVGSGKKDGAVITLVYYCKCNIV
ncbi:hypothetical protein F3004_21525 [Salmonella enterica]|nr:hypothetical protein [Salmonella enterica]